MKKAFLTIIAVALTSILPANAQLLDFGDPIQPFSLGFRAGVNQSNISNNFADAFGDTNWSTTEWGNGFSAGVVADMKLKNYLAIEPGFFFQSRKMTYLQNFTGAEGVITYPYVESCSGTINSYNFNIPVIFSLRLDLLSLLQARFDVGPYFQFGYGGHDKYINTTVLKGDLSVQRINIDGENDVYGDNGIMRSYDWGFKVGAGLTFASKYFVGIHYMAGMRNCYKQPLDRVRLRDVKGHNKSWDFTIGYYIL